MLGATSESFEEPLAALGQLLAERGQRYELFAVGGAALQVLGLITRPTRDLDGIGLVNEGEVLPLADLPGPLERAIQDTAAVFCLQRNWFNAGPRSLLDLGLPEDALARAHRREWGGLVLHIADRVDQIFDRGEGFRNELRGALHAVGVTDGQS